MSQVPNSVLWFLEPPHQFRHEDGANCAKQNLLREASVAGISIVRIIFARRVAKPDNIYRMLAAYLFLDTFHYGAQSTASDSLRAGLPVLTLVGDSFASRVGFSLLENVGRDFSTLLAPPHAASFFSRSRYNLFFTKP